MTRSTFLLTLALALAACGPSTPGEQPSADSGQAAAPDRAEAPATPADTTTIAPAPPVETAAPPATPPSPPAAGAQGLTLEFAPGQGSSSAGDESVSAEGGERVIRIRGAMTTPNPCYRLAGAVAREGGAIVVRITGTSNPERMCIASIGSIPFTATVRGVPAGSHPLRVVLAYPGTGWETKTALDTRVTVR
ncbi:MAG TPA: hypothetical protein VFQ45_05925 [Longimicrobium sp.]|nr:hypothetical protein [Longimicrobium sp.]